MKKNVAEFLEFRYEKLKLLKRSERGEVWLASIRQSGDLVIFKRVAATGLPYDVLRQSNFTLPAKVLYCAADESETVIVEEFIQGETLLARLERRNFLSEEEARAILLQMCDGLAELHAQNIIHRDIKPSNMILQGDKIRLIDFDAARIFKDGKEEDTNLLGTKGYAPPEQFGYGQTDQRSDIYSLGVTMKILLGSNCGERLKDILDKCTELDPKNRFQSVDELKAALLEVGEDGGVNDGVDGAGVLLGSKQILRQRLLVGLAANKLLQLLSDGHASHEPFGSGVTVVDGDAAQSQPLGHVALAAAYPSC